MPRPLLSRVVEDYLTLIWKSYEWPGGKPTTSELAIQLGVTASTVSANLKKLAQDEFITYEPYGRILLSEKGRAIAIDVVRRHRILETYLHRQLGLGWDQVHEEADQLEHVASDLLLERMYLVIGSPSHDPHGDPIPDVDGRTPKESHQSLADTVSGIVVDVVRVSDRSAQVLKYLGEHHIAIGTKLKVHSINRAAGSMELSGDFGTIELSLRAANFVRVTPTS